MIDRNIFKLRSTRDLRAEVISLAAELATNNDQGRLIVVNPAISPKTVQEEWDRMLPAIAEQVRHRLVLAIQLNQDATQLETRKLAESIRLPRPNYRYEILRILLEADLSNEQPPSILDLIEYIGASQTPIRAALEELKSSGLVRVTARGILTKAEDISLEALARIRAMPPTIRFRFERGANIKPPPTLLERAKALLGTSIGGVWDTVALSGVAAAQHDAPAIDIAGIPRLDLVAVVDRRAKTFDAGLLRLLDDGLEPQKNILEPAAVVITLVRSNVSKTRQAVPQGPRYACPGDVLLALVDLGLREQSRQYLRVVRP